MKAPSWPIGPLLIIVGAIALFAAPAGWEGAVLVPISPGHAISTLDGFAVLLLVIGTTWLYVYLWRQREWLAVLSRQSPGWSSLAVFTGGVGLGLLIASAFSSFYWWWALGAAMYGMLMIGAIAAVMFKSKSAVQVRE